MTTEQYNGWTNRETWLVNLWLTNEQGTYETVREMARGYSEPHVAARAIEEFVDEMLGDSEGMATDLLNAALSRVNWREIVESLSVE